MPPSSSYQTILSVTEFNRLSHSNEWVVDYTTGRDLHPAPEDESYYIMSAL